jgi:hypothetical protein
LLFSHSHVLLDLAPWITLPLNLSNVITIHPPSPFTNVLQLWLENDLKMTSKQQFQLFRHYLNALAQFYSFKVKFEFEFESESELALVFYIPLKGLSRFTYHKCEHILKKFL